MTNGNDPATGFSTQGSETFGFTLEHFYGLTKREYFASQCSDNEDEISIETCVEIMGCEPPKGNRIENLKWWFSLRAKLRLMQADALINELNK